MNLNSKKNSIFALTAAGIVLSGCMGGVDGTGQIIKNASANASGAPGVVGESCHSDDPDSICLGVKYAVYKDGSGNPIVSQDDAIKIIKDMNGLFKQCKISFQIDEFAPVEARDFGLNDRPSNSGEMDQIRKALADDKTLLITTTGTWNRDGTLGNTGANAWTNLPSEAPFGVVLEKPVGKFSNIIAHEMGHYLDLLHESNSANLMNPVIYDSSVKLSASQCSTARDAAKEYWQGMMR